MFNIKEAEPKDIESIYNLFSKNNELGDVSTFDEFKETFNWLFVDNNKINYLVALNDSEEIIAGYGLFSFPFLFKGEKKKAGLPCWLIVDKNYRTTLIALIIAKKLLNNYSKNGIEFSYAMAIRSGLTEFHKACGYRKIGDLPIYSRPVNINKIADYYIKFKILKYLIYPFIILAGIYFKNFNKDKIKEIEIKEVKEFDNNIDEYLSKELQKYRYTGYRDNEFMQWRYKSLIKREYIFLQAKKNEKIIGYTVLRKMKMDNFDVLSLVDFLYNKEEKYVFKALISEIVSKAYFLKVDMITFLCNPKIELLKQFSKVKFFNTGKSFSFIYHKPKKSNLVFEENCSDKWFITWYDHDWV